MRRAANRMNHHARLNPDVLSVVDQQQTSSILKNRETLTIFFDDLRKSLDVLRLAVQRHDIVTLVRVAHYLHGAAVFVDAPALAQLCNSLQHSSSDSNFAQADELVTALEIESAWLWTELNDHSAGSE